MTSRTILTVTGAVIALGAVANADVIQVTQAERAISVWASGYGYDFNDIDGFTASSSATVGVFAETFDVELFDYYGQHVAQGIGSVDSEITCDSIRFRFDGEGISEFARQEEADGGMEATLQILFDLDEAVRVTFDGASNGQGEYAFGSGSLREVGVSGPALAVVGFEHGYPNSVWSMSVLEPGSYRVDADLTAWAFGGWGVSSQCDGFVDVTIEVHHLADVNMSGLVDVDDVIDVILAFDSNDDMADVDRSGWVTIDDVIGVITAWAPSARILTIIMIPASADPA